MKIVDERVKTYYGRIEGSHALNDEILSYTVSIEGYNIEGSTPLEKSKGIPVFNYGYNSVRYKDGARVLCIAKANDVSEVFIIGEINAPSILRGIKVPEKGEVGRVMNSSDKSGITPTGKKDFVVLWSEKTKVKLDSKTFSVDFGSNAFFNINEKFFSFNDNSKDSSYFFGNTFNAYATGGMFFKTKNTPVKIECKGFNVDSGGAPITLGSSILKTSGSQFISSFSSYSFTSTINPIGSKTAIGFNVLKGDYHLKVGNGNIKNTIISPTGTIDFKIGFPIVFAAFKMDGTSGIEIKAGTSPMSQSIKINLDGSIEINSFESVSIEVKTGDINLTTSAIGKVKIDSDLEVTGDVSVSGDVEVEGDIDGDGEVTANAKSASVSLSTHKHSSAAPGAPSPPISGT